MATMMEMIPDLANASDSEEAASSHSATDVMMESGSSWGLDLMSSPTKSGEPPRFQDELPPTPTTASPLLFKSSNTSSSLSASLLKSPAIHRKSGGGDSSKYSFVKKKEIGGSVTSTSTTATSPPSPTPPDCSPIISSSNKKKSKSDDDKSDKKSVTFDTEHFDFFDNGRNLNSRREWQRCWYKVSELETFHKNARRAAQKMFFDVPPTTESAAASLLNCVHARRRERNAQSRELLTQIFLECRNIKREEDMATNPGYRDQDDNHSHSHHTENDGNDNSNSNNSHTNILDRTIDREGLIQLYKDRPDLVGLEAHLLSGLRGETAYLRHRILAFVHEKIEHEQNDPTDLKHYRQPCKKSRRRYLYAKTSQTISRPSRVYVHELALAQAAASVY